MARGIPSIERNTIRVFDKVTLMKAAKHAEDTDKNRSVYTNLLQGHINEQKDNTMYPIVFEMIHNDREFRVEIEIDKGQTIWLDIDMDKLDEWTTWYDVE